ncbi:DinB family protein [Paenibacillus radicis (ex Xue et al. 2023)]|uniref:DinB family protein n=1 Tax=Paenibacillus radicis (ex Xue et al. 2023) TaxID=2972489 RepID=A0ABT1YR95_9BACL|nr:DinB family protein [Paenibacillus radicis (ex Xue et al. 2023)]MCR8635686.1 DinB family protein [Paenibacillus radicis (ex Xue et al. 2023)]
MTRVRETIDKFNSDWLSFLKDIQVDAWNEPISIGKASIAEIIGHLINWDQYLLTNVVPTVKEDGKIMFPEFDSFNRKGYAYARQISRNQLIADFASTRKQLVAVLLELPAEVINRPTTANGASHCPHTGEPYSLLYIIQEFTEHDEHHRKQIHNYIHRY